MSLPPHPSQPSWIMNLLCTSNIWRRTKYAYSSAFGLCNFRSYDSSLFFQFNLNNTAIALQGTKESAGECFSLSVCILDLTGDMSTCQRTAWPVFQEQETSHILYTSDRSPDSSVTLCHRENKYTNFPEQVCKASLLAVSDFLVTLIVNPCLR